MKTKAELEAKGKEIVAVAAVKAMSQRLIIGEKAVEAAAKLLPADAELKSLKESFDNLVNRAKAFTDKHGDESQGQ